MPRQKNPPITDPILKQRIKRPYDGRILWSVVEKDKFNLLDDEFIKRERALFAYFGLPYTKIEQPEVRELIRLMALSYSPKMVGFDYVPFTQPNEWLGDKGVILYLEMQLEYLKLKERKKNGTLHGDKANLFQAALNLQSKYENTNHKGKEHESLYQIYQRIKKKHYYIQQIEQQFKVTPPTEQQIMDTLYWFKN